MVSIRSYEVAGRMEERSQEKGSHDIQQDELTTILATLLLPLEGRLSLLNQVLALVDGMVLDLGVVRLL